MAETLLLVKRPEGCTCGFTIDVTRNVFKWWTRGQDERTDCFHGGTVEVLDPSRLLPAGTRVVECEECGGTGRNMVHVRGFDDPQDEGPCPHCFGTGKRLVPSDATVPRTTT